MAEAERLLSRFQDSKKRLKLSRQFIDSAVLERLAAATPSQLGGKVLTATLKNAKPLPCAQSSKLMSA